MWAAQQAESRRAAGAARTAEQTRAPGPWNGIRALDIARSAIEARSRLASDPSLRSFQAEAQGRIGFYADFGDGGERLLRADQIALSVLWQAPGNTLQTIIGRRNVLRFPIRIRYHIDHLSLVLDNLGDRISIGEGDEIRGVVHPAAPGALDAYDYRLVDSLGLRLQGKLTRVYRLEVRPSRPDAPGLVGTLDIDRDSRTIARIAATFTPESYADPTIVSVAIELESGFQDGKYWLPVDQRLEVKRHVRWMDMPFGSTIRARYRVSRYRINPPAQVTLRPGQRVAALSDEELRRFAGWETGLVAAPRREQWRDSITLASVRRRAETILRNRYLGGDSRLRLYVPDLSSALRGRRAEGLFAGAGARYELSGSSRLSVLAGYAFGRRRAEIEARVAGEVRGVRTELDAFLDRPSDIGPFGAASGLLGTLGLLTSGDDFVDSYFSDGITAKANGRVWGGHGSAALSFESHEAARLVADPFTDPTLRPVRPILEGEELRLAVSFHQFLGTRFGAVWTARARTDLAGLDDFGYTRWLVELEAEPGADAETWRWDAHLALGAATGTVPAHRMFLLGGRGTVPGYGFRAWGGDRTGFARVGVSRSVRRPWLSVRGTAAVGWTDLSDPARAAAGLLGVSASSGLRTSLGGGVGLLYDLVRIEAARGLDAGVWEWMVSLNPAFRAPL